jgi:hypothetical protein
LARTEKDIYTERDRGRKRDRKKEQEIMKKIIE